MTRSQIRTFVQSSSPERIREVLDLRNHKAFFRELADAKLRQ